MMKSAEKSGKETNHGKTSPEYPSRWRLFTCFLFAGVCVYCIIDMEMTIKPGILPKWIYSQNSTRIKNLATTTKAKNPSAIAASRAPPVTTRRTTAKSKVAPPVAVKRTTAKPKVAPPVAVKRTTAKSKVAPPVAVKRTTAKPKVAPPVAVKRTTATPKVAPPKKDKKPQKNKDKKPVKAKGKGTKTGRETLKEKKRKARTKSLKNKIKIMKGMQMEEKHKVVLLDLLRKFLEIADELKLVYMIHGGSLIGSWRHHGIIPWDDDIDVLVNNSQKGALLKKIDSLNPEYLGGDGKPIIKFRSNRSSVSIGGVQHRWPFIDILFFEEKGNIIWDNLGVTKGIKIPKDIVFPLHKRPFENFTVNAPRNTPAMLKKFYSWISPTSCVTWLYNHRTETGGRRMTSVPCRELKDEFPFVHRKFVNGTMIEVLKLGDHVIHTKRVEEPNFTWTPPYSLKSEKT